MNFCKCPAEPDVAAPGERGAALQPQRDQKLCQLSKIALCKAKIQVFRQLLGDGAGAKDDLSFLMIRPPGAADAHFAVHTLGEADIHVPNLGADIGVELWLRGAEVIQHKLWQDLFLKMLTYMQLQVDVVYIFHQIYEVVLHVVLRQPRMHLLSF